MNRLLENVIKDRFRITAVKMEHLRSSSHYELALQHAYDRDWACLEALLQRIQIIPTRTDMRHTKETS